MKIRGGITGVVFVLSLFIGLPLAQAKPRSPVPPLPDLLRKLHRENFDLSWSLGMTNTTVTLSNFTYSESFSGYALQRAGSSLTPFVIPAIAANGKTNVACSSGSLRFWFLPYWDSASKTNGTGPGATARLAELVVANNKQVATVWSLQVNAEGTVLSLVAPGESGWETLLETEISWSANEWRLLTLNYGPEGAALYGGTNLLAEGKGTLPVPPSLAGLVLGSSVTGSEPAQGELDEVYLFPRNYPLDGLMFYHRATSDEVALGPIKAEEIEAEQKLLAQLQSESGGGMMMFAYSQSAPECLTNGPVYMTNVVASFDTNQGWTVAFTIQGGTNEVPYDIFSTKEIIGGHVTNSIWTWEDTGYTCNTYFFTNQPTNQVFFILTMPGADLDADGLYDGWEWKHFGTLAQTGDGDFDGDGDSNGVEFSNGTDPNTIEFLTAFLNDHVNSAGATGAVEVLHGVPAQMAVLVNNTNFASATWLAFNTNVIAGLGSSNGIYEVWIGLRGRAESSEQTWEWNPIVRDTAPPGIVITNPIFSATSRPMIQLQGYSPEPLASIRFDLTNIAGILTNQEGFVTHQFYETNSFEFTTNWFECLDLELTNGVNTVTLRVTDLAGNLTVSHYSYTLDYSGDTNAPVIKLYWPQNGSKISGSNFTARGWLDDPTAKILAQVIHFNGTTNRVEGLIERSGLVWAEALPLEAGTNWLTLTATDAAGNLGETNFSVVKSDVVLTINDLPEMDMYSKTVSVSGTISTNGYTIWVNGTKAALDGSNWSVTNVLNEGGTAIVQARAIPTSDNSGNGSGGSGGSQATFENPGNPMSAGASDAEADKEKAAAIRILSHDSYYYEAVAMGPDYSVGIMRYPWVRGVEFSGTYRTIDHGSTFGHSDCQTTYTWPPCIPELSCPEGVLSNVCVLNGVASTNLGSGVPPVAGWYMDYCKRLNWRAYPAPSGEVRNTIFKVAKTAVQLRTGGKALSQRLNLFTISASALEYLSLWNPTDTRAISPTDLTVGSLGKLGNDGKLFKVLADNTEHNVTIQAKQKQFSFDVVATKHKLVHQTVCTALTDKNPERTHLGVGEIVSFYFVPELYMTFPEDPWWLAFAGSVTPFTGTATWFTAPSNAANATVRVIVRDAQLDTHFSVLEPSGVDHAVVLQTNQFGDNSWGASAYLRVFIAPTDVSFSRVEIEEVGQYATNVSGRYAVSIPPPNGFYTSELLKHESDRFVPVSCDNRWHPVGYPSEGDSVRASMVPPLYAGGFTWPIPANWRIPGGPTNQLANWSPQVVTVDSNGVTRITKFGIWVERTTNDVYKIGP